MGIARIQAAADEVNRLAALCNDHLDTCTGAASPPAALLRQLACAGRDLVLAIGEHVALSPPVRQHDLNPGIAS